MNSGVGNWSDVRVFLAVFRMGSTLAASKELGLSQPTVARRIDALEHILGLTLFERNTRGFQPTPEAQALVPFAQAMGDSAQELATEARRLRSDKPPIRFTASTENFAATFKTVFAEFKAIYPETRFEFIATDRALDLSAGEADIAVRHGQRIDDPNLICRKMGEGKFALYASRSYVEEQGFPASEAEFRDHAVIAVDGEDMPRQLRDWVAQRVDPAQIVMTCTDWASLLTAVHVGVGVGPIATSLGDSLDDVVRFLDLPDSTSYVTMLLVSPHAYRRKDVRDFTAFFAPRYAALSRAQRFSSK